MACPPDITIACDAPLSPFSSDPNYNPELGVPTVLIPCELVTFTYTDNIINFICSGNYTIQRNWNGSGDCNATLQCTQLITLIDNDGPIMPVLPAAPQQECGDPSSLPNLIAWADQVVATLSTTDNCGSVTFSHSLTLNSTRFEISECFNNNSVAYYPTNFIATDDCGNTSSRFINLFEEDNTPPVIACNPPLTLNCNDPNREQLIQDWIATFTANDLCRGTVPVSNDYVPHSFTSTVDSWGCGLSENVTFTATDDCGNTSSCTREIRLTDDTPPIIVLPPDLYLDCDPTNHNQAVNDWKANFTATDECGPIVNTQIIEGPRVPGDCPNSFSIAFTFIALDHCSNQSMATANLFVEDNTPPVIQYDSQTLTLSCDDPQRETKILTWLASFSAVDDCDPVPYIGSTYSPTGFDSPCGLIGNQEINFLSSDACSNQSTLKGLITITPVAPSINCRPDQIVTCMEEIIVPRTALLVDGCVDIQQESKSPLQLVSGQANCAGAIYEVTRTVVDICGQQSSCAERYIIQNPAPSISCIPGFEVTCKEEITVAASDASYTTSCGLGANLQISGPVRIGLDNCSGTSYTYRYILTDACGRMAMCERSFTINNSTPTITVPSVTTVSCLTDIQVSPNDAQVLSSCELESTISISPAQQQGPNYCPGTTYTYTYTVQDACGRRASADRVFVLENEGPQIILPADLTVHCIDDIKVSKADAIVHTACDQGYSIDLEEPELFDDYNCTTVTLPYTYTIIDACGRSNTAVRLITVEHKAPFIETPEPMTMDCLDEEELEARFPFAFSYCGELTYTIDISEAKIITSKETDCSYELYTVLYSVTDECGIMICVETQLTVEQELVRFTPAPQDTVLNCGAQLAAPRVVAYGACGGLLEIEMTEEQYESEEGHSILERRWTADSPCGSTYEHIQRIEWPCAMLGLTDRQQPSSSLALIEESSNDEAFSFLLFPNPVQSRLHIEFEELSEAMQRAKLRIFSRDGKEVHKDAVWINEDRKLISIPLNNFPAGLYTLSMSIDGVRQASKTFVKLNQL